MIKAVKLGLLLCAMLCTTLTTQAQKIGYLNSAALLAEMPEVKKADANLSALQKQMQKQGEAMQTKMQAQYQAAMEKAQKGSLPKAEEEQTSKSLQQQQQQLAKFEEDMQKSLGAKREALLSPILKRVDDAIKVVAKEKGYKMIFDSSTGAIVYADGDDITVFVKAKLGMAATPGKAPATVVSPTVGKKK